MTFQPAAKKIINVTGTQLLDIGTIADGKFLARSLNSIVGTEAVTAIVVSEPLHSSGGATPTISLATAMGGSLTGTYPNPTIAPNAVGTSAIDDGAVTSAKLDSTGVVSGSYGSSTAIPVITVNTKGQLTLASTTSINVSANAVGGQLTGTIGNASVTVGGDLTGPITGATVTKIQNRNVASNAPATNDVLRWSGTAWAPVAGGGDVNGPASATSSAIALYDGITGKVIKNSTVTIDGSGNIVTTGTLNVGNVTGGTYNGITVAAHAARHAPTGPDALGTAAPTTGIGAGNAEGNALTFARSNHNHALRTDSTDLTIGTIAIGQYLKRVGTTIVGAAAAGAAKTLIGNFVGALDAPFAANARWYPPSPSTVTRAWASLGEHASGVTEFDVLKNGVSILPSPISIATGDYRSLDVTVPSVAVLTTEHLTISLITANGGSNAVVFVEYE